MDKPKQLKLQKVKSLSNGGVEAEYSYQEEIDGQFFNHTIIHTSDKVPHADFTNELSKLRGYLASTHGIGSLAAVLESDFLTAAQKKAAKSLEAVINAAKKEQLNMVHISGVSLSGGDSNPGVIITGTTSWKDKKTALNSPRIRMNTDTWGWEAELQDVVDAVTIEAEEYFFNGKKAQPELFDVQGEENKDAA